MIFPHHYGEGIVKTNGFQPAKTILFLKGLIDIGVDRIFISNDFFFQNIIWFQNNQESGSGILGINVYLV